MFIFKLVMIRVRTREITKLILCIFFILGQNVVQRAYALKRFKKAGHDVSLIFFAKINSRPITFAKVIE